MAGKFIICFIAAFALIQPFNTLPAAEHKPDVIFRNSAGQYYTSDGVILTDQHPIFFRPNVQEPKKEHVVIVEPTVTYSRQAEYSSTQASPSTNSFRPSPLDNHGSFRPYDGRRTESASTVAYYPYYLHGSSSSSSSSSSSAQSESSNRVTVDSGSDSAYQRFVPRGGSTFRDERGQTWYIQSDGRAQSSSQGPPPPQPTYSGLSNVQFYFSNGTVVNTRRSEDKDNKHIMEIYPNQYVIEVNELTTTTPRPTIDCPPYPHPCNGVVYQQTTQCCKCYLVPTTNRCCPCIYPNQLK